MNKNTLLVTKVEGDFRLLCEALNGLDERDQALFLAKLALVLADLVKDPALVEDAVRRARLNLPAAAKPAAAVEKDAASNA